ncbi:MAG: hypothetical protein R3C59_12670 [Planctomycetaceae bacterium]
MTDSASTVVILLASDLMLTSTISGHAASAGVLFRNVGSVPEVATILQQSSRALLLVDLGTPQLDVHQLAASVAPEILLNAVAYGPHVHETRLQNAKDAGFGRVMSRGQFSAQVGRLIETFKAPE